MKTDRIFIVIIVAALLAVSFGAGWQMVNIFKEEQPKKVSVIVNNSSLGRWNGFNEGLRQGASDRGIRLNIVSTGEFTSMNSEKDVIEKEISNGADALIIQIFSSYNQSEYLEKLSEGIPLVLVENDSDPEDVFASVTPDNKMIGQELAGLVKDALKGKSCKRIGILAGNQEQLAMFQRLAGLRKGLEGSDIDIAWQISGYTDAHLDILIKNNQSGSYADAIVSLGDGETEKAIDYYAAHSEMQENVIFGVGNSEKAAYYLDKGLIADLLVIDDYNMGYSCIKAVSEQIDNSFTAEKHKAVGYHVMDSRNMYDMDNQLLLFPKEK